MRIHLVVNYHRPDALEAAVDAAKWMKDRGVTVAVEPESGRFLKLPIVPSDEVGDGDLVIAFGGDGTLIRAAHLCSETGTPVLGVYYGRFGFVTQCKQGEIGACISAFLDGKSIIESRMMIQGQLVRGGAPVASIHALNEIVLQRAVTARMMTFRVTVDNHLLTSYPADGVMVSTPTGSTAYNLSAGGPILDPNVQALMLTAIAPHTLNSRTLILRPDSEIKLEVLSDGDAVLSADGQTRLHLLSGDEVHVQKSPRVTNLISVEQDDFLIKLGERLLWSQGLIGEPH